MDADVEPTGFGGGSNRQDFTRAAHGDGFTDGWILGALAPECLKFPLTALGSARLFIAWTAGEIYDASIIPQSGIYIRSSSHRPSRAKLYPFDSGSPTVVILPTWEHGLGVAASSGPLPAADVSCIPDGISGRSMVEPGSLFRNRREVEPTCGGSTAYRLPDGDERVSIITVLAPTRFDAWGRAGVDLGSEWNEQMAAGKL
ncbi:hypothetical protein MAPG_10351 [Magnaporthiopsis poae ATCC 64411]|uniref:Uncharacterized protein n=1 Tax=Magnaporthiopsis poae (strain ATCC 64411 / 73-15) TaxID=644358 RepID=A0A0C4ECD3_MAGP6|nr:hypothetical protein MAPG_10351 [Magnaporthiopsis poae ATCC 64411]